MVFKETPIINRRDSTNDSDDLNGDAELPAVRLQNDEKEMIKAEEIIDELVSSAREENSSRLGKTSRDSDERSTTSGRRSGSGGRRELNSRAKKKIQIDPDWLSYYPNIPGNYQQLTFVVIC